MTNPQTEPWGGYIPEVNAGRYESGTGPGTWLTAAASWEAYAAMVAEAMLMMISGLAASSANWTGVASTARDAVAAPFMGWLAEMEAMALENSMSCLGVATAFEAGNASMIPLPVVNQNRISEAIAEATNFLGCNEPLIQYLNAEYARFWGENASTMMDYDSAIQVATTLRPVMPPPPLANAATAAADDAMSSAVNAGAQSGVQGATSAMENAAGQFSQGAGQGGSQFMQMAQQAMGPAQQLMSAPMQMGQQLGQQAQQLMSPMQSLLQGMGGGSSMGSDAATFGGMGTPLGGMGSLTGSGGGGGSGLGGGLGGLGGARSPYGSGGGMKLAGADRALFSGINQKSAQMTASIGSGAAMGPGGAPMGGMGAGAGSGGSSRSPREILKAVPVASSVEADDYDEMFVGSTEGMFTDD